MTVPHSGGGGKKVRATNPRLAFPSEGSDHGIWAIFYFEIGWSIIPIRHRDESGKQPACREWKPFQTTRPSRTQIEDWFKTRDLDGLAVILGSVSGGLCCRDFDKESAYDQWTNSYPELAEQLPTVFTRRGAHVYFRADLTRTHKYADGELKGNGYCLLPASRHPSGHIYRWKREYDLTRIPEIDPFSFGLGPPDTERAEQAEDIRSNIGSSKDDRRLPANTRIFSDPSVPQETEEQIMQAIQKTQPTSVGHRNLAVFAFARALKGIPALANEPIASLRPAVIIWHQRALPIIGTKPFEDTWFDFAYGWDRVNFPAGTDPFSEIIRRADSNPLPACAYQYDAPETRRLVAICRELQLAVGDGMFFLSSRTVAVILDISAMTAWRRLGVLVLDGILEKTKPRTKTKATRFRYKAID